MTNTAAYCGNYWRKMFYSSAIRRRKNIYKFEQMSFPEFKAPEKTKKDGERLDLYSYRKLPWSSHL
jgi:hypothetical protein